MAVNTPRQTDNPQASATTQADKPEACPAKSSQAGRDAVLIHGLAFVFAAAAVSTNVWVVPGHFEYERAVAVGGSAAFILIVWSLLLAVRALLQPGSKRLPAVVLALFGLEATAVCLLILWVARRDSEFVRLGFLVFIPVFVLASMAGVPVAWWRSKPRAGTSEARGRWKRGLAWYCAVTAVAIVVLLPCPLFLYCSHWASLYYGPAGVWQAWVIEHTPVAVGEATASILSCLKWPGTVDLYNRTLLTGRVSQARLMAELTSTNGETQASAIRGLFRRHQDVALEYVNKLADGQVQGATTPLLYAAGNALGTYGSAEQIRPFLDAKRAKQVPYPMLQSLLWIAFCVKAHAELLPELERFCEVDSPVRTLALQILANCAPPENVKRVWAGFLADKDPLRRAPAITALRRVGYRNGDMLLEIVLAAFETRNEALHRELIEALPDMYFRDQRPELLVRLVKTLLPFLEEDDLRLRRASTSALASLTNDDSSLRIQCDMLSQQTLSCPAGAEPPETPAEQELVKKVRGGALKWLQDAEQVKREK